MSLKSVLLEPLRNFLHALALEEIYNPAAFAGLVVEPCALADIDAAGAVGAPAQFFLARVTRIRLAPEMPGHIGHGLGELGNGHDASHTGSPRLSESQRATARVSLSDPHSQP